MTKYKCIETCTWLKRYWRFGDIYEGDDTPPRFFVVYTGKDEEDPKEEINPVTYACDCEEKDFYFDVLKAPKVTSESDDTSIEDDKPAGKSSTKSKKTTKTNGE